MHQPDPPNTRSLQQPNSASTDAVNFPHAAPGTVIGGKYKLLEAIGEGGMGSVWMAQQTEPVKRMVAVKLIKAGMDTKNVLARFEAERQALALMEHPNIARVLDVGTTDVGRPFFVMELVKGKPITEFCDQRKLTPRQRLELFVTVCQAIQHAHQKGIIHRDIKPSNVLVALHDDTPVAKVIDFGVAKAIGTPLTDKTLHTGFEQVAGTPAYMSPEQATFNQLDIDTRSDIYSLGVLLYELLTGTTPIERHRFKDAAMLELLRVVREEEPPRPSTRLSTAKARATIAAVRGSEPSKLSRELRGELDWIALKALDKDRTRRYETATGLAADVQRYLSGEAVTAHPPSVRYKVGKFLSRHRGQVAVTAAFTLLILSGGIGVAWWKGRQDAERHEERTKQERDEQERAARNTEAILALVGRCEAAIRAGDATLATTTLGEIDRRLSEGDSNSRGRVEQCRSDVALLADLNQIDNLRWAPIDVSRGNVYDKTNWAAVVKAWAATLPRHGIAPTTSPPEEVARRISASLLKERLLGTLDMWLRIEPSTPSVAAVLHAVDPDPYRDEWRTALSGGEAKEGVLTELALKPMALELPPRFALVIGLTTSIPTERRRQILESAWLKKVNDVNVLMALGELDFPNSVRWYQAAVSSQPSSVVAWQGLGRSLNGEAAATAFREAIRLDPKCAGLHCDLGNALMFTHVDQSIVAYREAIRLDPTEATYHVNLGYRLSQKGDLDEAIKAFRAATNCPNLNWTLPHQELASALLKKGDVTAAISVLRDATKLFSSNLIIHHLLGTALSRSGDAKGAIAEYREAVRINPGYAPAASALTVALVQAEGIDVALKEYSRLNPTAERHHVLSRLAVIFLRAEQEHEMSKLVDQLLSEIKETLGYSHSLAYLGEALVERGKLALAERVLQECLAIREKITPEIWWTPYTQSFLGEALYRQKKYTDAEQPLAQSYQRLKLLYPSAKGWDQSVPDRRRVVSLQLVAVYEAMLKPKDAAKWREESNKYPESAATPTNDDPGNK